MTNILYKASDGTEVPGYLTVPTGVEKKNLPLVVLPHDGPVARDSWKFSYLRTFLAAIRRKLEPTPSMPRYFLTEPGMGYRFVRPEAP